MSVCRECCVLSGRGLCDGLITRPEESNRLWCVVERDLETSSMRRPWPTTGCRAKRRRNALNNNNNNNQKFRKFVPIILFVESKSTPSRDSHNYP